MFDLHNVIVSIPLPALRDAPSVKQIDGEWRYALTSSSSLKYPAKMCPACAQTKKH